jgi:hypothetical protein
MDCRDCPRHDADERRCRDGKINPRDWETAVNVANVLGLRSICVFNDHRERLVRSRGNPLAQIPLRAPAEDASTGSESNTA